MGELCLQSGSTDPGRDLVLFLGPSFPEPDGSLSTSGEDVWLFMDENSTDWLSGFDYLFLLRCPEETYFMLLSPCLGLLEVF